MQINTLQATEYKGYKVYIRNFNNIFEYLVIYQGELYTTHIVVTKTLFQTVFARPYTEAQLESATKVLMNMAQTTIDYLLEKKIKHKK